MAGVGAVWRTRGMISSEDPNWATPDQLFHFLNREFDFYLDVCATAETSKARRYFHHAENGLDQDWYEASLGGQPIWMNPPYGRKIGAWIRKAWEESQRGCTVVTLLPSRTDTSWWHDYCMKGEIRFLRGRLRFNNERRGRAPFPSAIVIFRPPHAPVPA